MNRLLVIGFVCCVFFPSSNVLSASRTLTFTTLPEGVHLKISERILKKAYSELGIDFTVVNLPSMRAIVTANNGESDGELRRLSSLNAKFPNLIRVPTVIGYLQLRAFSLTLLDFGQNNELLENYSIAIVNGARASSKLTEGMPQVKKVSGSGWSNLFKMLLAEHVEVVISDKAVGLNELRLLKNTQEIFISKPLTHLPLHHYLHKKHASLVPRLDAVLQAMEKKGEIAGIREAFYEEIK